MKDTVSSGRILTGSELLEPDCFLPSFPGSTARWTAFRSCPRPVWPAPSAGRCLPPERAWIQVRLKRFRRPVRPPGAPPTPVMSPAGPIRRSLSTSAAIGSQRRTSRSRPPTRCVYKLWGLWGWGLSPGIRMTLVLVSLSASK